MIFIVVKKGRAFVFASIVCVLFGTCAVKLTFPKTKKKPNRIKKK